jgi:hypothetical protein
MAADGPSTKGSRARARFARRTVRSDAASALSNPEAEWQLRVLERIEGLGDPPFARHMFADLIATTLPWHSLMPEYQAYWNE